MSSYVFGGQRICVLDMDVERGGTFSHVEDYKSFAKKAEEIVRECEDFDETDCTFLNVYSEYGTTFHTSLTDKSLRLCLTGSSYVYPTFRRRMSQVNALKVFYNNNGKFVPLWELRHFNSGKTYTFLNPKELQQTLQQFFTEVTLKLGALTYKNVQAIAWQVETNKGTFFIPWHSGAIIDATEELSFEEKPLNEMNDLYTLLRFTRSNEAPQVYKVTCC